MSGNFPSRSLRIGYLSTLYHTSFLLQGTGLLERRNISPVWELFASGPEIVKAMGDEEIDIGYIGLPPVVAGIGSGLPLVCIAGGHADGTVMVARREFKGIDECGDMKAFLFQFEGSVIGVPPKGSIHDVILRKLLADYKVRCIEVKNYPWADFIPEALLAGEIAGAVGTPALAVASRRYGNARMVLPPHQLWPFNPSYGIVVSGHYEHDRKTLAAFLTAHEIACEWIRRDYARCAYHVASRTGWLDEAFIRDVYRISPRYCAALPREYISSTMRLACVLKDLGYIERQVTEHEIFDTSLIKILHPDEDHYSKGIATGNYEK